MDLLHDVYEREPSGALHYVATGQRLVPGPMSGDQVLFEYRDREINIPVAVSLTDSPPADWASYFGREALVDWNLPHHRAVKEDYSLWRRLTWFLLDALFAWLIAEGRTQRSVLITGGWFNGAWLTKGRFYLHGSDELRGADALADEIPPYDPIAPRRAAPTWRFEPGVPGAREGRLDVTARDGELPLLDGRIPLDRQLSNVPRFVGSDRTILFFHRVDPHSGPEYSPSMQYGLVGSDYAFYFNANHGTLRDTPIALGPGKAPYPPRLRERESEFLKGFDRWRLHPALREQQFFAGAEANALFFETPRDTWPTMRSVEHDQEMLFGGYLGQISDAPISVGRWAQLKSWPRLSTDYPEPGWNLFQWWRGRRAAREKRRWLALQELLLSGKLPLRDRER